MLEEYPKEAMLKDGTPVQLRPLAVEDAERLVSFFQQIAEADRWYLRHDVREADLVRQWAVSVDYARVIPIVAVRNECIVGDATLHRRGYGASRHVGEVRIVIDPAYRGKRLGTWMILDLIQLATGLGLEKLVAEMPGNDLPALRAFQHLDFVRAGVIPELSKAPDGYPHDRVVLVKNLAPAWTDF